MNKIKIKRRINQAICAAKYYIVYVVSKFYQPADNACGMGGEKRLRKPVYLLRNETMPQKQCANTQKINKNLGNI